MPCPEAEPKIARSQFDGSVSFEGFVGEQAMKADGDPEAAEGVQDEHDDQLRPADAEGGIAVPEEDDGGDQASEGEDDREEHHDALEQRHALGRGRIRGRRSFCGGPGSSGGN